MSGRRVVDEDLAGADGRASGGSPGGKHREQFFDSHGMSRSERHDVVQAHDGCIGFLTNLEVEQEAANPGIVTRDP
ncbi:MAG: hypothetical protein ABGX04_15010 [Myxococcales bacterium]